MKIIWLGHGSFRIEIEDQVLLIDPWISGSPVFPEDRAAEALEGATQILVTHAHFDHIANVVDISREQGLPVSGMYELVAHLVGQGATEGAGFNKGGTIRFGKVAVSMVPASHSSSTTLDDRPVYMGTEVGFMISGEGHTIYMSGDTTIMADMEWMGDYYKPDVGIISAGGHFTMDMKGAAYAARRYFDFKTVIPCHYRTFPLLEQDARVLKEGLPGVDVIEPEILQPITL